MSIAAGQLGQVRPANTNPVSLYSPGAGVTTRLDPVWVCNNTASVATCRVFLDHDGATYDQTTALEYDLSIAGYTARPVGGLNRMNDSSGNLAVRTDTAGALTFSVCGIEIS